MTAEENALWERIAAYGFGTEGAPYPFSSKLIERTGWTSTFAFRAIEEYKRFVFLAVVMDRQVTPSRPVDEVWHLHLLYTREYWERFCPQVLSGAFHHTPSTGAPGQDDLFVCQYRRTLHTYESYFGPPPPDMWPRAGESGNSPSTRSPWKRQVGRLAAWLGLALSATGCTGPVAVGPLDWNGPDFLAFFVLFGLVVFALAGALRWWLRLPGPTEASCEPLHGIELAYLNGGSVLTVNAAVAGLVSQGSVSVDQKARVTAGMKEPQGDLLQRAIFEFVTRRGRQDLKDIRRNAEPLVSSVREHLKASGLVVPDAIAWKTLLLPFLVAATVPTVGALKITIGLQRERPVEFLVILTFAAVIGALAFLRWPNRSRLGDVVMRQERERYGHVRNVFLSAPDSDASYVVLAVGVFGLSALDGTDLSGLKRTLQPPSGSSSCGGGDGGGGGCGGGGGGCGGCGGD